MKHIYKAQTALRITLKTGVPLSKDNDTVEIHYKKPDGVQGIFEAAIKDEETGTVYHDFQNANELDEAGWWSFWVYVCFADGRTAYSQKVNAYVYEEGE